MHQKRFVVLNEILVELNLIVRMKRGNPIDIGSHFRDVAIHIETSRIVCSRDGLSINREIFYEKLFFVEWRSSLLASDFCARLLVLVDLVRVDDLKDFSAFAQCFHTSD